jgi:hypothetical protein
MQGPPVYTYTGTPAPSGTCYGNRVWIDALGTGTYYCNAGTWAAISGGGGGGAPTTAQYWTGAADGTLSAEKNLGALGTGIVINTGGVPSIKGTNGCLSGYVMTATNALGVPTCTADIPGNAATASAITPAGTTSQFWRGDNSWAAPALSLSSVTNPTGDWTATFPTGAKALWTFTGSTDEAFTIHGDGAFTGTGDLVHINKTGTGAAAGSDALHVEVTSDTNMTAIRATVPGYTDDGLITNGAITSNSLTLQGVSANDSAPLGAEILTDAGWTSTGWTGSWSTGWTHTAGNTTVLSQATAVSIGTRYQIAYTITGRTAGSITVALGGLSNPGVISTGAFGPQVTATTGLTITPTTDFNGTIAFSMKAILGASTPTMAFKETGGISRSEIRVPGSAATNMFIGSSAGRYLTTGSVNYGFGNAALANLTTGVANTAVGASTLTATTTGGYNVSVGYQAGFMNTTGIQNVNIGYNAGYYGTTVGTSTAVGASALFNATTGYTNTAVGSNTLYNLTTGTANVAVGGAALFALTTTNSNVGVGYNSGRFLADGTTANQTSANSTYIGANTRAGAAGVNNETVIGYNAIGNGSNTVTIGSSAVTDTYISGDVNATTFVGALTGNASTATTATTATALAAAPTTCSLPNVSLGILANGTSICGQPSNVTGSALTTTANVPSATKLFAAGTTCTGQAAKGVDAYGNAVGCFNPPAAPAGADTQFQFNDSSALAGAASATYNKYNGMVTFATGLYTDSISGTRTDVLPIYSGYTGIDMHAVGSGSVKFTNDYGGPFDLVHPVASQLGATGTPSATTYLRGDNTWATPSGGGGGTPGGATTQVQFNDGGAFAGSPFLTFNKTTGQVKSTGLISGMGTPGNTSAVTFPFIDYAGNPYATSGDHGVGIIEGSGGAYSCANLKLVGLDGDQATQTFATALHETSGNRNRMLWEHWNKDTTTSVGQLILTAEGEAGEVSATGHAQSWWSQGMPLHIVPKYTSRLEIAPLQAGTWTDGDYLSNHRVSGRFTTSMSAWADRTDAAQAATGIELGVEEMGSPGTDPTTWTFSKFGDIKAFMTSYTDPYTYEGAVQISANNNGQIMVGYDKVTADALNSAISLGGLIGGAATGAAFEVATGASRLTMGDGTLTYNNGTTTTNLLAGGGGGGSVNSVEVDIDFSSGGNEIATTTVTGQTWVTATSKITCSPTMYATSSRAEGAEDVLIESITVAAHSRVAATGFTLTAHAPTSASGVFKFNCIGG